MPQFDSATFPSQLVWLVITFVALYFLMARVALPRIAEVLERRQRRIAGDLEQAERLRDEAGEALRAYEAALGEARAEAQAVALAAREAAASEVAERSARLEAKLGEELAEAEKRIAGAKNRAIANLAEVAIEVARAACAKLIGVEVEEAAAGAAVAAELEGSG